MATIDRNFIWTEEVGIACKDADTLFFVVGAIASSAGAFDDGVAPEKDGRVVVADRGGAQAKRCDGMGRSETDEIITKNKRL